MRAKRIVVGLIIAGAVALCTTPALIQFAAQSYLGNLTTRDFRLNAREIQGHFVGLSAAAVTVWLPIRTSPSSAAIPLSIELQNVSVSLRLPLFPPRLPIVSFKADAYQGSLSGELHNVVTSPRLSFKLSGLALSEHPQLLALGVTSGALTGSAQGIPLQPEPRMTASAAIQIDNMELSPPPLVSQLVGISAVRDLQAQIAGAIQSDGNFTLQPVVIKSSLASIQGRATGHLEHDILSSFQSVLQVKLSEGDGKGFAQWLPIISNNSLSQEETEFTIASRTIACSEQSQNPLRIGSTCLSNSFSPSVIR